PARRSSRGSAGTSAPERESWSPCRPWPRRNLTRAKGPRMTLLALIGRADLRVPVSEWASFRGIPPDQRSGPRGLRGLRRIAADQGAPPGADPLQGVGVLLDRLRPRVSEARLGGRGRRRGEKGRQEGRQAGQDREEGSCQRELSVGGGFARCPLPGSSTIGTFPSRTRHIRRGRLGCRGKGFSPTRVGV